MAAAPSEWDPNAKALHASILQSMMVYLRTSQINQQIYRGHDGLLALVDNLPRDMVNAEMRSERENLRKTDQQIDTLIKESNAEIERLLRITPQEFITYLKLDLRAQMSPNTIVIRNCWVCYGGTRTKCSKCGSRTYCSRECQEVDWVRHKRECADFRAHGAWDLEVRRTHAEKYIDGDEAADHCLHSVLDRYKQRCKVVAQDGAAVNYLVIPGCFETFRDFIARHADVIDLEEE